jgi:arylsulfatase A-like enzyme
MAEDSEQDDARPPLPSLRFGSPEDRTLADSEPGWSLVSDVRLPDGAPNFTRPQLNGYATSAFGKWHLTPNHVQGPAGPFDLYDPMISENTGTFDDGWDADREETSARRKQLGVIAQDTVLTSRNEAFPAPDSISAEDKKLHARRMEVSAGDQEDLDWSCGHALGASSRDILFGPPHCPTGLLR